VSRPLSSWMTRVWVLLPWAKSSEWISATVPCIWTGGPGGCVRLSALGALADCVAERSVASCANAPGAALNAATVISRIAANSAGRECERRFDHLSFTAISFVCRTDLAQDTRPQRNNCREASAECGANNMRISTGARPRARRHWPLHVTPLQRQLSGSPAVVEPV